MFQKTFFFAVDGIGDCAIGVHFPEPKKKERKKNTRSNDHPTRVKTTFQPEKRRDISKKKRPSSSIATVLVPERSGPNFIPNETSIFVANGFLMCSHD